MSAITITEALAEIKTIQKRIEKKRESIMGFLYRQERLRDPLEKEGGSRSFIARERQAIGDLETRLIRIRQAISEANAGTDLAVQGTTRSIAEWLVWRREISDGQKNFLGRLQGAIQQVRREATQKGLQVLSAGDGANLDDVVVNVNEQELAQQSEQIEEILGTLDGLLSLKNATITIEV